jgi:hypothetical protein
LRVLEGNPALIDLDLPLPSLVSIVRRRKKILTYTQINKNNKSQSLSDYAQQDLSVVTQRPKILDMKASSETMDSSLRAPTTNHF